MAKSNKNSKVKARAAEHEKRALELRVLGFSYARIAEDMELSVPSAWACVDRALKKRAEEIRELADDVRELELQRIDEILPNAILRAKKGDDRAIQSVIKLMDRRARYLGLDAPIKTDDIAEREKAVMKLAEVKGISAEDAWAIYNKARKALDG